MFDRKTRTAQAYDSKIHLDRVKYSCSRRRKGLINSNRPWSSSIGCRKSAAASPRASIYSLFPNSIRYFGFCILALGISRVFRTRALHRYSNNAAQDLITRSTYLRPFLSQELRSQHAHVLKRYVALITRVDPISYGTVASGLLLLCRRTLGSERH